MCRAYGWTVEYVLAMPVQRFFAMRRAAIRLEASDRAELVSIAAVPTYTQESVQGLQASFRRIAENQTEVENVPDPKEAHEALRSLLGR